jgi:hypothetical protein
MAAGRNLKIFALQVNPYNYPLKIKYLYLRCAWASPALMNPDRNNAISKAFQNNSNGISK